MPQFQDYRRLFEESPTPMFVFALRDFRMLAVNESALAQYRYSRDEFLHLTPLDIRPPEDEQLFREALVALPDGYHSAGRYRHRRKDGDIFFVQVYTRRTVFMMQEALMVLAVDINEQVKAQQELAEKIKDTDTILDSITDGFFILDRNWRFFYLNKESERVFRLNRQSMIGQNLWDLFPAARSLKFYTEYKKVFDEKVSVHFQEFYPELDIWVEVNAYPFHDGIAVYFLDINERKNAELAAFRDQQNLLAIINNTKDIIWSMDTQHRIISANEAFWQRLEKITGKQGTELEEGDFAPKVFTAWQQFFERALKGESYTVTWEEETANGTTYEEISFNPIYDADGTVSGISCFSRNVTAEREHLRKIEQQNTQLREIAWMQSHDIRKHVANILGLVSLIETPVTSPADLSLLFSELKRSAQELDQVIRNILLRTQLE